MTDFLIHQIFFDFFFGLTKIHRGGAEISSPRRRGVDFIAAAARKSGGNGVGRQFRCRLAGSENVQLCYLVSVTDYTGSGAVKLRITAANEADRAP